MSSLTTQSFLTIHCRSFNVLATGRDTRGEPLWFKEKKTLPGFWFTIKINFKQVNNQSE